jgi:zinc transporter 9
METRKSTRSRRDSNSCVEEGEEEERERIKNGVAGLNATLGLVIHAMADGIALGASSLSESGGLGFVVFLAVIVHKGELLSNGTQRL